MTTNDKIETRQIDTQTFAARRGGGMLKGLFEEIE